MRATTVAIGVFDGVHIGHKKIIKELLREAAVSRTTAAVVTFHPHPAKVLKGASSVPMLISLKHRLRLLKELGVKAILAIRFNKQVARTLAKDFIKKVLIDRLNMKTLVVGENFSFGSDRVTNIDQLGKIAKELGFKLTVVKAERYHSRTISSSLIRHLIEKGELNAAGRLLGRPVSILGTVVKGGQRGRILGFKTANIYPHHEAIPPSGVYAVYSKLNGEIYKSVLNIGTRPTFGEKEPTIEVHIFGVNTNLYGRDIEVYFKRRLRPERRFKDKECLRRQIMKDVDCAERIL